MSRDDSGMPDSDLRRLVRRLHLLLTSGAASRLVVLLGAGMNVTAVPDVSTLTRLAREYSDEADQAKMRAEANEPLPLNPGIRGLRIAHYIEALKYIREACGRDGLQVFLQRSAMHAFAGSVPTGAPGRPLTDNTFAELIQRSQDWHLTEGLTLLTEILRNHGGKVHRCLLTTNLDPLVEVALRRARLPFYESYGVSGLTASINALRPEPVQWTVVQLHGNCHSSSLHSPALFGQPQDEVEEWLAEQLRGSYLLVLGYSGWDGLIQRTLLRHFGRDAEEKQDHGVEILWAVYESLLEHPHVDPELADFFERYRDRGVTAYYGIDRDRLFRTLTEELWPD